MRSRLMLAPLVGALLFSATPVRARDAVDKQKLEAAIAKGLKYLRGLQQPDGNFAIPTAPAGNLETTFKMGYTALATLTLLKCGTPPNDPSIEKAFRQLYALKLRRTYSVSLLILCIEARYAPPKKTLDKSKKRYTSVARKFFRARARKVDRAKLQECVNWLVTRRSKHHAGAGWRYPSTADVDQDNSNTQYAMLAMKGARRLGAKVPLEVFEKVADFFVAQQDATGPEVPWFAVPAADGPIHEMVPIEKRRKLLEKHKKKLERARTKERKQGGERLRERRRLFARGWSYEPRKVEGRPPPKREGPVPARSTPVQRSTGSMTSSGVAALCIAKSELEAHKRSWSRRREAVNTAIRDGCAWLAKYWNPKANPVSLGKTRTVGWKYYYLYSCERAGVLAGTYRFGPRDWWEEGAAHLLTQQRAEGSWPDTKGVSRLSRTCFALLFLKRATIPLVPLPPKRVMTGRR